MALAGLLGSKHQLKWQKLKSRQRNVPDVYRCAVHGGWLVSHGEIGGLTFIPDPDHEWDGDSFPIPDE